MKNGLLLVNLGSPADTTTEAVKHYLNVFLGDPNVVTMPRMLWQPILKNFILPKRSPRSAALYREIWTEEVSPLIVYTERLRQKVQEELPEWDVQMAMTYEQPAIADKIAEMKSRDENIIVLSLFPQFTQSSAQSIIDQVKAVDPSIPVIDRFGEEEAYLDVLAKQIQEHWEKDEYDRLMIAYHGIPQSMVKHGDPYEFQTEMTFNLLKKRLDIPADKIKMVYQSKFGPMPWLQPYLNKTLVEEAKSGTKKVLVSPISFVTDCLETLHEDGIENRDLFLENGGEKLTLVPALNDRKEFAEFVAEFVQRYA
ncbi:MAG: ferrochelatase [Limosilactobacillus sp.]|uniref:ferrochelatase n=1 Tax=Limosilactobacillus sp. TaxID=2773925 RepID=UPI002701B670|nr:ferrochelatase [Limosilactobacillus sp.]